MPACQCGDDRGMQTADPAPEPGPVVAYVPDLMDRSRIAAAVAAAGRRLVVATSPAQMVALAGEPGATFLVDLSRPGAPDVLAALPVERSVGFAGHVERDLISRARAASGATVIARSRLFATLADVLGPGPVGGRSDAVERPEEGAGGQP